MFGQTKLSEEIKASVAFLAKSRTTANTLYNDAASGAVGIDCKGFAKALLVVNIGTVTASDLLDITVTENDTDDAATSVAVSGAVLTQVTAAQTAILYGVIDLRARKRYLYVKVVKTNANGAAVYGIELILGHKQIEPVVLTEGFSV